MATIAGRASACCPAVPAGVPRSGVGTGAGAGSATCAATTRAGIDAPAGVASGAWPAISATIASEAAIASMKAKDGLVNAPLEVQRLKLTIETAIDSEGARKEGFGQINPERLKLMAEQVAKAYATQRPIPIQAVWNGSFLPSAAELDVLPKR